MYHFISGYTAKVAGTERGITEPQATFSPCFGGPFLTLNPLVYGELLKEKMNHHGAKVYLVNTGWSGGSAMSGASRMSLPATRAMVTAILDGSIEESQCIEEPVFGLEIPTQLQGVDSSILNPRETWQNKEEYDRTAKILVEKFRNNFKQYSDDTGELQKAGP
jgi:phosphoenolpyruvate carboxykinase (ATP)